MNHRTLLASLVAALLVAAAFVAPTARAGQAGKTVTVGSKNFTEQLIVGQIVAALLEHAGYQVDRKLNLGGTAVVHQALVSGDVDVYVEYTGTGLTALLKLPAQTDPDKVYETVKREYESRFKATWLSPWGFNNTYALAMRADRAQALGVKTIADLEGKAQDLTFGGTQEFITRPDGLPGIEKTYGLKFKQARGMDFGIMYQAVASGQVDVASAFATDGRIAALNLVTLEDNKRFFPPYYAAPVVRQEVLQRDPKIAEVLNTLAGKIDDDTMRRLNAQVDQEKKEPADVARAFLKERGYIN
ncbi:MAG TPA: glycine betaine ABC transporter substrate-binding protein [Thermodesulfobacteriota bacterium]